MHKFRSFIEDMNLIDLSSIGGVFISYNSTGTSMTRLGRFLFLNNVVSNWKVVGQSVGQKDISNHCLVWLKAKNFNWEPNCSSSTGFG